MYLQEMIATIDESLTFDEITSVDSIDSLARLYEERRAKFNSESQFLKKVNADWKDERKRVWADAKRMASEKMPDMLQSIRVDVEGSEYYVHGISHDIWASPFYLAAIWNTLANQDNWLSEQNISTLFKELKECEMMDHVFMPDKSFFALNFLKQIMILESVLLIGARLPVILLRKKEFMPKLEATQLLEAYIKQNQRSEKFIRGGMNNRMWLEMAYVPLEAIPIQSPAYVQLELACRPQNRLNKTQERSAYMAEFLRAWNGGREKRFIGGALHASEVAYFLTHRVNDNHIIELAQQHAELLQKDPEKYSKDITAMNARNERYARFGESSGLVLTMSGLFSVYYVASKLLLELAKSQ